MRKLCCLGTIGALLIPFIFISCSQDPFYDAEVSDNDYVEWTDPPPTPFYPVYAMDISTDFYVYRSEINANNGQIPDVCHAIFDHYYEDPYFDPELVVQWDIYTEQGLIASKTTHIRDIWYELDVPSRGTLTVGYSITKGDDGGGIFIKPPIFSRLTTFELSPEHLRIRER